MELKKAYDKILQDNLRKESGYQFTIPSSRHYPHQWLWDSCFHAIIFAAIGHEKKAKDEIRSLFRGQWENGLLPHMIYSTLCNESFGEEWGTENTSSITQPPMVAYAVEKIYIETGDKVFVKVVFDKLDAYYTWLYKNRADDYLVSIIHPWESGLDDFPSWDSVYRLESAKPDKETLMSHKKRILAEFVKTGLDSRAFMKKEIFNVKDLVFNSIYLRNLKSMLSLAKAIGSDRAEYYENLVNKTTESFRAFYDKKNRIFRSFDKSGFLKSKFNFSIFMPLFAEVLETAEAKELVNRFGFSRGFLVPTVSVDDENYEPDRYWRGSVWINVNWFIVKGLSHYGLNEAKKVKENSMKLAESGFYEYYDAETGKGLGPSDFTWSGLVFDM